MTGCYITFNAAEPHDSVALGAPGRIHFITFIELISWCCVAGCRLQTPCGLFAMSDRMKYDAYTLGLRSVDCKRHE